MNKGIINLIVLPLLGLFMLIACDTDGDPMGDALLSAAKQGDIQSMQAALDGGASIDYVNPNLLSTTKTACCKAAAHGQLESLQWLVDKGADWHKGTAGNENPITLAAANNHFDIVFYLIEEGEDVNYQETNYGFTALLSAAKHGNVAAAKKLIALGADTKVMNKKKQGAIHLAARHCKAAMVDFLYQKGLTAVRPLHTLVTFQNDKRLPADAKATIDVLLRHGVDINAQDGSGFTALHIASQWGNDALMNYLIDKGADSSIQTNNGMTVRQLYNYFEEQQNS